MSTKDKLYIDRRHWDFYIPVMGTYFTLNYLTSVKTSPKFIQGLVLATGFASTAITTYLSHKNYTDQINNILK